MAFHDVLVTETFYSLQGETSHVGIPYFFIRLTGCNLRCTYCDTTYSFKGGSRRSIDELVLEAKTQPTKYVLVTGGEPLLQRQARPLIDRLIHEGFHVSIETHGEISIQGLPPECRVVMDVKTPGSGMCRGKYKENLTHLRPQDEIKFVITDHADFEWAIQQVQEFTTSGIKNPIYFSPSVPQVNPTHLADWIVASRAPVRFQYQLHKILWGTGRGF